MSLADSQAALLSVSLADIDAGTLLPSTGIPTIFVDRDGQVKGFTPSVSAVWSLKSHHIGTPLHEVPHQVVDMPPLPDINFLLARGESIEHEVQTLDSRWYQRHVHPRRSKDGRVEGAVITFIDITDRKRVETRLVVERTVTRLLADADSFHSVASELLAAIAGGLDAEFCALWMRRRKRNHLSCSTMIPSDESKWLNDFQQCTRSMRLEKGEGLPGRVWLTGRPEWVHDIAEHPRFLRLEAAFGCGLRSGIAFPILAGDRVRGVIELYTTRRLSFHDELEKLILSLGCEIGDFVHRRQADDRLDAERLRKLAILESSLDCIVTMDHEGRIVDFNPAAVKTLGYAPEDVVGQPLADILVPERYRQQHHEGLMHFLATGTGPVIGQQMELSALRADGTEIPVEVAINAVTLDDGTPFFTGFLRDITERKQEKKRQLRRQKIEYFLGKAGKELSASLDHREVSSRVTKMCVPGLADWALLDLLNRDGTVERVEVAFADPTQRELAARIKKFAPIPGKTSNPPSRCLDLSESIVLPEFTEEHLRQAALSPEHEQILRDVKARSFISVPLMSRGVTLGALTLARADSNRRYGQDDLKVVEELAHRAAIAIDNARLYEAAEHANRAKSDFLANMSHEIRTPMTAILGYADVLAARVKDPICSDKIAIIKRNGQFLLEIINDILDLSKIEAGRIESERERIEVAELVGDVLCLMQLRASEKGLQLRLEYATEVPDYIVSDPVQLRQILVNLIGNAIKFTEEGTVKLVIRFEAERRRLIFDVVDTGIGISPDTQDSLFEPFNQGDTSKTRRYGGTGLGLTICRRLAEMLGGGIVVESQPGRGSCFTVHIDAGPTDISTPSREMPLIATNLRNGLQRKPPVLNCRVLVVDDREDIRRLAQHFVTEAGGKVTTSCDGLQAIAAVRDAERNDARFDIILMDMQMPNLDGREATKLLRTSGFRQPIVAITADAMQGDRERTLMAGCDDYLAKPIDQAELIALIARYTQELSIEEIESRRRSTIQLEPPASDEPESMRMLQPTTTAPSSDSVDTPRILIVDDWPDTSTAMAEFLQLAGYHPLTADNGRDAIDTYLEWQPVAVLMDLGLPDMDGCDALRQMRQCAPLRETLFVAITGREDERDVRRAKRAGFHEYLVKPASIHEVTKLLKQHQPV